MQEEDVMHIYLMI